MDITTYTANCVNHFASAEQGFRVELKDHAKGSPERKYLKYSAKLLKQIRLCLVLEGWEGIEDIVLNLAADEDFGDDDDDPGVMVWKMLRQMVSTAKLLQSEFVEDLEDIE